MTTGFTGRQARSIIDRDQFCVLVGTDHRCNGRAEVANHRAGRGIGGLLSANRLANGCALCNWHNFIIEADAATSELARFYGVKLSRYDNPETIPLWSPLHLQWVYLTDTETHLTGQLNRRERPAAM
jgi:hypothetical protein